jgi:uncharacterized protein YdeI (YjbR/CyaY-like superfamily)
MSSLNPQVDKYLVDGCMRCKYGATPRCKVSFWKEELTLLRHIVLESGLTEEIKWGVPVYTQNGKNVMSVSALKESAVLSFFKGQLLSDPHKILQQQGNIQSGRIVRFTDHKTIADLQQVLKEYIAEAIEIEKSGKKVEIIKNPEPVPEELLEIFENDPVFRKAFYALTPGRQRGYIVYFSQPKQSQTRLGRIEKYRQQILNGIGLNDEYRSR